MNNIKERERELVDQIAESSFKIDSLACPVSALIY